jgi:diguanylate cyclase (GGDEF)-like protein
VSSRLWSIACLAACLVLAGWGARAAAQESVGPDPKPAGIAPGDPVPQIVAVPGAPDAEPAAPAAPPFQPTAATAALPRSGVGGVIVEPGQAAVDITSAVSRYLPPDLAPGDRFASYLIDFVNRTPVRQTRILILDPGLYGGPGAPATLSAPPLDAVLSSDAEAHVEVIETGARTRIRLDLPAETTVTAAFRYAAPLNTLTVEMWDERALARFQTASLVMQGALLGLVTALGAWLAGLAILRRDRMASWLAALFGAAFLALLFGFGFAGPFALLGIVTNAGLALGLFAGAAALALAFVVHALAPDGRWRSFAWFAEYVPWLVAAAGLAALFNAPYAAAGAKAGAALALVLSVGVVFARAWEGDGLARRLTLAAIFVLLAFAPLSMLETVEASGRITMLAASGLLAAGLLLAAFAVSAGAPKALRQRVDWVMQSAAAAAPPPAAARPVAAPSAPGEDSRFGLALAAAHQGLWDWDLKRDRLFLSPSVEVLLGARPGQLQASDRDWSAHIHPDDLTTFLGALEDYRKLGDVSFALDFRANGHDGLHRWVQLRASFMSDGDRAARCIGLVSDVSAQKEGEALLLASARQDSVTGLSNRAWFLEALGHRLGYATGERRFALLAVDIARFRTVNESLGHAAGDALLAVLADRLRAAMPEGALAARLGGDVFGLLWVATGDDAAAEAAKFMLDTLVVPVEVAGRMMTPAARGGLVMLDGSQPDSATALADAEAALAEARRPGGAGFTIFKAAMRDAKADRAVLEGDLAGALARSEIVVHYQPVVRVADRSVAGFEALVRWAHPGRGLLAAEAFAGLAEETGLIDQIGRFVLEAASRDAARWRRMAPQTPPLFVNVNVSARQLTDNGFLQMCERLALDLGAKPDEVRLEITETLAIDDSGAAAAALQRLRRAGFGLVMDDFGAGHSTLSRLARLPFDAVKIDGSFLREDGTARNVLAGLIRLARDLGLEATAEGVESEEDFAFLAAHDCPFAQGYHCGRPSDAAETQRHLLERTEPAEAVE